MPLEKKQHAGNPKKGLTKQRKPMSKSTNPTPKPLNSKQKANTQGKPSTTSQDKPTKPLSQEAKPKKSLAQATPQPVKKKKKSLNPFKKKIQETSRKRVLRTTIKDENSDMKDATSTIDKLRLALLYRDKESGKKDRRLLETERKYNNKQQALYATCKKFLLNSLEWFENENIEGKEYLKLQVDPKFDSVLYDILNSIQFESYSWIEEDRNEDLISLGAAVPRVIVFSVRYISN